MEKIWLKSYQEGVPSEIDSDRYPSLSHLFLESCEKFKDNEAFSNLGTTMTYQQLEQHTLHFASFLQQTLGMKKGDRIAIMMPNLLQYPVAIFGALRAGLTVVNTNPLYTADELSHQLKDSGATTILVLSNFAHTVEKALTKCKLEHIIITDIGDLFPTPKRQIVNFVVKYIKKMVPKHGLCNTYQFIDALNQGKSSTLTEVPLSSGDIAFLQYTGGTTGVSKGAILTHHNMVANVEQAYAWITPVVEEGKEIIITALPLYHIFSLTANCLSFIKSGAKNILITNPRDMAKFIKEIAHSKFTAITGVNTLFNGLLNHSEFKNVDFSALKYALSGGMALQESVAKRWLEVTGKPALEAYGLTETSPAVCMNPLSAIDYNGSVGFPVSSTEVSIRDDQGNELAIGESGELCIKGPQVMQGYWQRPDETAKVFWEDGFLRSGDIAKIDEKGYVSLVDRKKDMILVSGFNVYPNEVEQVIGLHPGVLEVGVIGVPFENTGERVKACIVKKSDDLTKDIIIAHCKEHLTNYKVPKIVEFRDDLPKTNVGKVLRRELR